MSFSLHTQNRLYYYTYVLNNPLSFTDPSGYLPQWVQDGYDHYYENGGGGSFNYFGWMGKSYGPTGASLGWANDIHRANNWTYDESSGQYLNKFTGEREDAAGTNPINYLPNQSYELTTYTLFESGTSLDGGKSFIGNGNFGIVKVGTVIPTKNNLLFTSRSSAEYFLNSHDAVEGGNVSLKGILTATISGLLSAEDAYNHYLHNHKTYRTTRGRFKNIFKANGRVRSRHAQKFATRSNIVKWTGVAGTAWMTGKATYNIVGDATNKRPISGWDIADGSVGLVGLTGTGLGAAGVISNPVGWGIGAGVATYGWFSFWYEMGATYGPSNR